MVKMMVLTSGHRMGKRLDKRSLFQGTDLRQITEMHVVADSKPGRHERRFG